MNAIEFRRSRLKELTLQVGGNATLGQKLGLKSGAYIGQMLKGDRPITEKFIQKTESQLRIPGWFSEETGAISVKALPLSRANEGVVVPLLATEASMGRGKAYDTGDAIVGHLTLSPKWIDENLRPITSCFNLRLIHSYSDSMEPTLKSGDILIVDAGIRAVDVDGIYVLEAQQKLFIKRVTQDVFGSFTISSDNPMVKTVSVLNGEHEVIVRGRVLGTWSWRRT